MIEDEEEQLTGALHRKPVKVTELQSLKFSQLSMNQKLKL